MHERWLGSMFACSLKQKPVNLSSIGSTFRSMASTGSGEGAMRTKHSYISFAPKVLSAEPKKTGANSPAR